MRSSLFAVGLVDHALMVLPRATTSSRERAQTVANAACLWSLKSLQGSNNSAAAASRRERGYRLDKLGVTGSSPVPPIESAWKSVLSVLCLGDALSSVLTAGSLARPDGAWLRGIPTGSC